MGLSTDAQRPSEPIGKSIELGASEGLLLREES
jgi:hypothetical protein